MRCKNLFNKARILFGLFFVSNSLPAHAQDDHKSIRELAYSQQWLKLGHYRSNRFSAGFTSEVDDKNFFISDSGKTDPASELQATVQALQQQPGVTVCRFPARALWLHNKLPDLISHFDLTACSELSQWRERIAPGSITLVFPASYINSPSSMFGHTLLRIDPPDESNNNVLLSWALNYGANTDGNDSGLLYAYKGMTGGYFGTFNLVPYFEKVKEYNDIDNRDIFEYRLKLDQSQIAFLLLHTWELRGIQFEYYYFDENCAYQLLTLLDVARPELNLANQFTFSAIPADTVKVIERAGLIDQVELRPSAKTEFNTHIDTLSKADQQIVHSLVWQYETASPEITHRQETEQFNLLKNAYRYSRLLAVEEKKNLQVRQNSYNLLRDISALAVSEEQPVLYHSERTEYGHASRRWGLSAYRSSREPLAKGALISLRPAYHDWLDPLPGFAAGANIELLDTVLYFGEDKLKLHSMSVAQVQALRVVDRFFNPTSWYAGGGFERKPLRDNKLDGYIHTGRGKAVQMNSQFLYGFLGARYETHNGLMPAARFGWVRNGDISVNIETAAYYTFVRDHPEYQLMAETRYHLTRQFSLQMQYNWYSNSDVDEETLRAGFYQFF